MDNEARFAYRVGIVVICAAIILAILVMLFGEGFKSQYTVFVETPTAPNVTVNTPVRKNGIRIGRVSAVENKDASVLLTLKIDSDQSLYASEVCSIETASFLGDAILNFKPGMQPNRGEALRDRMTVAPANVLVASNPVDALGMLTDLQSQVEETLQSFQQAGQSVDRAATNIASLTDGVQEAFAGDGSDLRQFLADARQLSGKLETGIDNFNAFMVNINELAGDPQLRNNVLDSVARIPETLEELNRAISDTRETVNSFRKVSESAEENLANLTEFTLALGEDGPEFIMTLNESLKKIDSLVSDFGSFAEGFGETNGTISKLLNDTALYDEVLATARNVRQISEQLKPIIVQLQPLMNDVRYFADGLARDPGQVGVRGAFSRDQPFSQFKGNVPARTTRQIFQPGNLLR